MLKKIRLRTGLLSCWEGTRFGTNPYKLHPLAHYVYYDSLNAWLPIFKKQGLSVPDMAMELCSKTIRGISPTKYSEAISSGKGVREDELVDAEIVNQVNILCGGDEDIKNMMVGSAAVLKYGR
ncbi:hypothetical protein N9F35_02260 [Gammaproteobacteria bacterium]|jgi:hypothetical protein|nr:hypothetical protein [Gammaproteobacteria bacterium]